MPPNNISETDAAWIAGFFDGEGCVGVNYSKGHPRIRVSITQKYPQQLEDIQRLTLVGTLEYRMTNKTWRIRIVSHADVRRFLEIILPYSRGKRAQIVLALQLLEIGTGQVGVVLSEEQRLQRRELGERITALKHE